MSDFLRVDVLLVALLNAPSLEGRRRVSGSRVDDPSGPKRGRRMGKLWIVNVRCAMWIPWTSSGHTSDAAGVHPRSCRNARNAHGGDAHPSSRSPPPALIPTCLCTSLTVGEAGAWQTWAGDILRAGYVAGYDTGIDGDRRKRQHDCQGGNSRSRLVGSVQSPPAARRS